MTQQIPEGWQTVKFGNIAQNISKRVEPSKTALEVYVGLEHLDPDSLKIKRHGVPSDVAGQKLLVKKGQIIFGKRRAYQRKVAVAQWDCICSAHAMVLEANSEKVLPEFLPFFMQSKVFMKRAVTISEGSLSPTIKWKTLSEQKFTIPCKTEQERILTIAMVIEDSLVKKADAIESSKVLLSASLQQHLGWLAKYNATDILEDRLPVGWKIVRLKDVLIKQNRPVSMENESSYQTVVARRAFGGIEERELLEGGKISVKSQFEIKERDFLISKRQIVHGGCGVVPKSLNGSIVSNEYDIFRCSDEVDLDYFFWLVQTPRMRNYFFINSVGIHIEKMLFKTEQWLNMPIILPPVDEQLKLSKLLNAIKEIITQTEKCFAHEFNVRQSLMESGV